VVDSDGRTLIGVVDLRELLLAADHMEAGDIMASPVVTANEEDLQEDIAAMFAKYHYEMIPVVDDQDRILGVILHNDIIKSIESRVKV
jgi:magnesium transporter